MELIDYCTAYIESRDSHYLAKEGLIVYFASITGRKSDYLWHRHTVSEALRIIKATRLTAEQASQLKAEHLIAAYQECERVYEFAVTTRHKVMPHVFNYSEHSDLSMGDGIMSYLCDDLQQRGFKALFLNDVTELFRKATYKLDVFVGITEQRELLHKHFEVAGYEIKTGPHRVLVEGKKQPAIMKAGTKPSEMMRVPTETAGFILKDLAKELK